MKAELLALGVGLIIVAIGLAVGVLKFGLADGTGRRNTASTLWERVKELKLRRLVVSLAAGLAVGAIWFSFTGWWAYLLIGPMVGALLTAMVFNKGQREQILLRESLAVWVRSLSGLITTGAGLETALRGSLRTVDDRLKPHVLAMVRRIRSSIPTERALEAFARELKDPVIDAAVCHLILAANERGSGLASSLDGIADSVDDQIKALQQVETERSAPRRESILLVIMTTVVLFGVPFASTFSAPYATPLGQMLFLFFAILLGVITLRMQVLLRPEKHPRLLERRAMERSEGGAAS